MADGSWSTIGGGRYNQVTANFGTIAGGGSQVEAYGNSVAGYCGSIGGGKVNKVFDKYGTIGGGYGNETGDDDDVADDSYATVPGGRSNEAVGSYSFAAGRRAKIHGAGSFMWADSTDADFYRTGSDRFYVRSCGGVHLYTSSDLTSGAYLTGGGSSWHTVSDRASKRNIRQVDGRDILYRLSQVPICQWSYKSQDPGIEHIGPISQDFYNAFGLGEDDKSISTIDPDGVALAAIQGLYELVKEKDARIAAQESRISDLEARLAMLEALVSPEGIRESSGAVWRDNSDK